MAILFSFLITIPLLLLVRHLIHLHLKWRTLSHIRHLPRAPSTQRGPWPLGDMRHCGPMSDPFRVSNFLSNCITPSSTVAIYRDYLSEPRLMLLSIRAAESVMCGAAAARVWRKPPTTAAVLTEMLGAHSLLVLEGDSHARLRRLVAPLFAYDGLLALADVVERRADLMAERCVNGGDGHGRGVDVYEEVANCTLGIMIEAVINDDSVREQVMRDYHTILERNSLSHVALFMLGVFPRWAKVVPLRELQTHFAALRRIKRRLREVVDGKELKGDLLDALVKSGLSDVQVLHQTLTFVTAGHGTTSVTACWALYLLGKHVEVQEAVREEYLMGMRGGEGNWLEMVDGLALLEGVIRETMRLFPGIVMTARMATEDCVVDGVWVPKGTIVSIPIMGLHRSKCIWGEDAMEFRPQRHRKGHVSRGWMAFLRGSHGCIGGRMAMLEVKGMICKVLERAKVRVSEGSQVGALGVLLVPTGLRMDFEWSARTENE